MQRKKIQEAMAHVYFQKMTPTGYHEIEQEIEKLQAQRPAKIAQLKAARALGDLSENTEYSTAKRELRHLESRLRYLNKQLQFIDDDEQVAYTIVGKQEADLQKQKISFDSPLGQALLHQKVGQTVSVQAPQSTYQVKILAVRLTSPEESV